MELILRVVVISFFILLGILAIISNAIELRDVSRNYEAKKYAKYTFLIIMLGLLIVIYMLYTLIAPFY
jgi:uncharacterized membrane protein YidH (DUF202 family)